MTSTFRMLSSMLCLASVSGFEFTDQLTGWYKGEPTTAPIGPMEGIPFIWSIQPVDKERGIWLMEDMFTDGMIMGSHQQFLVTPTTITYCGLLRHFITNDPSKPATVLNDYIYQSDVSNNNQTVWCAYDQAGGCETFIWTMKLLSATSFNIKVMFPPSVHADVTFTLQGKTPSGGYPQGIDYADRKSCQLLNSGRYNYGWNTADYPHYDSFGAPSAEIQKVLKNTKPRGTTDLVRSHKFTSSSPYSFCYVINNQTQFKLEYNFTKTTKEITMRVSAKTTGWAAVGFYPLFPGMEHAKVIMGSQQCGVSAMEAKDWVGTPVASNWTDIKNPTVASVGGIVSFSLSFTAPPEPQWRSNHEVMFAVGDNGDHCSNPSYHNNLRGLVTIQDFAAPEISLNPYMKC
eukprot:TRINITY_DN840_c0_g1_i1.p1 TRINITY_DN840_c0_g1~~TRINITY_DN840_c0_g1_i1.p1  ORF type:complete len:401 (+),score=89.90 TRINITY_DN840_c0_g1_i1:70-1272(+)